MRTKVMHTALRICLFAVVLMALALWAGPGPGLYGPREAGAAFPGLNGKIAFDSNGDGDYDIYVMNADGSDQTRLTNNTAADNSPDWSPDGSKIAFYSDRHGNNEIYKMNADGSDQTRLTNNTAADNSPAWSPDGSQIAFESDRDGNAEIYVMNADGSDQTRLTSNTSADNFPDWSPDGAKIAFGAFRHGYGEIYVMNADGSGQTRLTNNGVMDGQPDWSPDGSKIAFAREPESFNWDVYVMNADGSGQTRLTYGGKFDGDPAWSPDGSKIAFASLPDIHLDIWVMNPDGSGQTRLTNDSAAHQDPDWQPVSFSYAQGWGPPAALNTNAATDSGSDVWPQVTTDGAGNWVAVWTSNDTLGGTIGPDYDILISRSTNNGGTWTAVAALNTNAATDSGTDAFVQVTTDGAGNWVAVWHSDSLSGLGTDRDILVSRSTNNGATWTAPAALNTNAATDSGDDLYPQVTTDGLGNWVAVWQSDDSLGGTIGTDGDILVSRSTNNGVAWTAPAALNTNANEDAVPDDAPEVTTDGLGNWVVVWFFWYTVGGVDWDTRVARSTNNGASWTAPAALNTNAATDSGQDLNPQVTTDGLGSWVAVWQSNDSLGGTIGTDDDILVSRSTNNGATWTAPAALNTNAATDLGHDRRPEVTTDSLGKWVAAWDSDDSLGGTIGTDFDILTSRSFNNGATWTAPAALNTNAASDSGSDNDVQVTTDGLGNWVAAWDSTDSLGGTIGGDWDILRAAGYLGGFPPGGKDKFYVQFKALNIRVDGVDKGSFVATGNATVVRGDSYLGAGGEQCADYDIESLHIEGTLDGVPVEIEAGEGLTVPVSTGTICEGATGSNLTLSLYIEEWDGVLLGGGGSALQTENHLCSCWDGERYASTSCTAVVAEVPPGEVTYDCGSGYTLCDCGTDDERARVDLPQSDAFLFAAVGGIAEWPGTAAGPGSAADSSAGSGFNYTALGGALAAAVLALAVGVWFARRRWVR